MKLILVGIMQDSGEIRFVKAFTNPTWAIKYINQAGDAARFTILDNVNFLTDRNKFLKSLTEEK